MIKTTQDKENKDCYVRVRITSKEKIALDNRCRMKKTTISAVFRKFIEEYVKQPIILFDVEN